MASACMLLATVNACGDEASQGAGPFDDQAQMREDLIELAPSPASPGQQIEVRFPEETPRGVPWVMEEQDGDTWQARWFLTATTEGDHAGGAPSWQSAADAEDYAWPDIGINGPGPDSLLIPDEATPGAYRLCTVNSGPNICALLEITG